MPLLTLLPLLFSSCAYQVEATKNNASTPSEKTTSATISSEVSFNKEKIKKTNQDRYGGNSPKCSTEIKLKEVEHNFEKYRSKI